MPYVLDGYISYPHLEGFGEVGGGFPVRLCGERGGDDKGV